MGDVYLWYNQSASMGKSNPEAPSYSTGYTSVAMTLAFKLQNVQRINFESAWTIVESLRFVVIYDDSPRHTFVYLNDMKEEVAGQYAAAVIGTTAFDFDREIFLSNPRWFKKAKVGAHMIKRDEIRIALGHKKGSSHFRKIIEAATPWFLNGEVRRDRGAI